VQVNLSVTLWRRDAYLGESAFIHYDLRAAGDSMAAIEFFGSEGRLCHRESVESPPLRFDRECTCDP